MLNKIKEEKFELFSNTKPSKDNWINTGSGAGFCHYAFVFNKDCARVELYIDSKDKEKNECIFDGFLEYKEKIENQFGETLTWERLEEKRACRIKYEKEFDSYDEENWDKIIEFMIQNMQKLEKSMKEIIRKINLELK